MRNAEKNVKEATAALKKANDDASKATATTQLEDAQKALIEAQNALNAALES